MGPLKDLVTTSFHFSRQKSIIFKGHFDQLVGVKLRRPVTKESSQPQLPGQKKVTGRKGTQATRSERRQHVRIVRDVRILDAYAALVQPLNHWHAFWLQPQPGSTHQTALRIRAGASVSKLSAMGSWRPSNEVNK